MLNDRGGFESDLTALRLSDEAYRLYVGTAAIKRDLVWLRNHLEAKERVRLFDETEDYAVLALMGPAASSIVRAVGADWIAALGYFRHAEDVIAGVPARCAPVLCRRGGLGDDVREEDALRLYDALYEAGARPSGLYAQTSMRIEKRYLAMGHDLDADVTPLEAGVDFAINWSKPFIGRDALARRRDAGVASASRRSLSTTRVPCRWATSRSISVIESSARRRRPRLAIASGIRLRLPTSRLPTSAKSKACASKST